MVRRGSSVRVRHSALRLCGLSKSARLLVVRREVTHGYLLAAALLAPAVADAGTAYLSGTGQSKALNFDAGVGEANSVQLQDAVSAGTSYLFVSDAGIQAGAGCTQVSTSFVQCPDSGVSSA